MHTGYNVNSPKRPVNLNMNEDLVRVARKYAGNLSLQVEKLLADYVASEEAKRADQDQRLDRAIAALNEFSKRHGAPGDEYLDDYL